MANYPSLQKIVGKEITGVVFKEGDSEPKHQLFLVFEDGTHFELYTLERSLNFIKEIRPGDVEWVKKYMSDNSEISFEAKLDEDS